jgi:hypothetical protein
MSILRRRKLLAAVLACGAGTLFQFYPRGCADYGIMQAVSTFDFCSVINCTGSTYFDICNPPLLMDCPNLTFDTTSNP